MRYLAALAVIFALGAPASAAQHPCAKDAADHAKELLRLHFFFDDVVVKKPFGELSNWSIDPEVKQLAPVKALAGKGKFDVLEVYGNIYKGTYRMRFIYAQYEGCTLMGQEILEVADPY
jgi:hypothetical protein